MQIKKDSGLQVIVRVKGGWVAGDISGWIKIPLDFIRVLIRGLIVCLAILAIYLIITDNRLISALL